MTLIRVVFRTGTRYTLELSATKYLRGKDDYNTHAFLQDIFDVTNMDLTAVSKSFGFSVPPFVDLPISNKPKVRKIERSNT